MRFWQYFDLGYGNDDEWKMDCYVTNNQIQLEKNNEEHAFKLDLIVRHYNGTKILETIFCESDLSCFTSVS